MPPATTAPIAAADVDPSPVQPPLPRRRIGRRATFTLVGVLAYAIGLIALIPASAVVHENDRLKVGGTIWRGEAVLGSVLHADWTFAPLTTLTHLAYSADWHMTGGATDLVGSASSGGGVLRLDAVSGQADGGLVDALAPRLPIGCSFLADVTIERLVLGGRAQEALGRVRTSPAKCIARGVAAVPFDLPALRGEIAPGAAGTSGALMTAMRQEDLVEVRLSRNGALSIWPTARTLGLAPFLAGQRYDTVIE